MLRFEAAVGVCLERLHGKITEEKKKKKKKTRERTITTILTTGGWRQVM